jgi:hypothetical protein
VVVSVTPPAGAAAYAVEEKPPRGWAVSNLSHEGSYDPDTGVIRWGVFYDGSTRALSYTLTPPPSVIAVGGFDGELSFDGQLVNVPSQSVTSAGSAPIRITRLDATAQGLSLEISGPAGQTAIIEESSDLVNWTNSQSIFLPDGKVNFATEAAGSNALFYRLRAQ